MKYPPPTLIWNAADKSIAHYIKKAVQEATHLDIAVAFFKESGLNLIRSEIQTLLARGGTMRMIVGTDFWQTEPEPLLWLNREFTKTSNSTLYIVSANNSKTFHPKLFLAKSPSSAKIIVGSANLTRGGLQDNWEGALCFDVPLNDNLVLSLEAYLNSILHSPRTQIATPFLIAEYEEKYTRFHKRADPAIKLAEKETKLESGKPTGLNEARLQGFLESYRGNRKEQEDFASRSSNYTLAREILDQIASVSTDSKEKFETLFFPLVAGTGKDGAWHSGYLFRHKNQIAIEWKKMQEIIRFIKSHPSLSPLEMFDRVKRMTASIYGLGMNIPTEIMNTYYPSEFAVLNNNPRNSLKELGLKYPEPINFKADDYDQFVSDLRWLKKFCGFESLGQADHFLNYIYWQIKPKK